MKLLAYTETERAKLDSVEEGAQANPSGYTFSEIGLFYTSSAQNPSGTGDSGKIKVNFGAGGNTAGNEFTVGADGVITCNSGEQQYQFEFMFRVGRTGSSGVSILLGRLMYAADGIEGNAVQIGPTSATEIDDADTIWPEAVTRHITPATGSKLWVEIARDESGNNSGGILTVQPTGTLSGWNASNSASLSIEKQVLV